MGVTTFDNKIWVIGGYGRASGAGHENKDVWYSSNGKNWTVATSSASFDCRNDHKVTTFDNKLWLIAGKKLTNCTGSSSSVSDAWYSTDGANWTQATSPGFSARRGTHIGSI